MEGRPGRLPWLGWRLGGYGAGFDIGRKNGGDTACLEQRLRRDLAYNVLIGLMVLPLCLWWGGGPGGGMVGIGAARLDGGFDGRGRRARRFAARAGRDAERAMHQCHLADHR